MPELDAATGPIRVERGPASPRRSGREAAQWRHALLDTAFLGKSPLAPSVTGHLHSGSRLGRQAAERGIKIKPVSVSGVLERTEWLELLRNMVAGRGDKAARC